MYFPENYDFHSDPSYLLAIEGKLTLENLQDNKINNLNNMDLLKLTSLTKEELNKYNQNKIGIFQFNLI